MANESFEGKVTEPAGIGLTCQLRVAGIDCPSCADQIRRAVHKLKGVTDVQVDTVAGRVRVEHAGGELARRDIVSAIRRIGYRVEEDETQSTAFVIEGMDCADEIRQIEGKLGPLPGVDRLQFDLMRRKLVVVGSIEAAEVQHAIKQLGMRAHREGEEPKSTGFWERRGRLVATLVSGLLLVTAGGVIVFHGPRPVVVVALAASAIAGGWFIAPRGVRAARSGMLDMNFLMTIAAIGAAAIGEWGEGASAMFLFSVAQMLEVFSMDRARHAIQALMNLSPREATVRRNGSELNVAVDSVLIGETIIIRPGQRVPLDGVVLAGCSSVNQSAITGESIPIDKQPSNDVFAGSVNMQGLLEVEVTKLVEDTTLARIIHAVEKAQASRAPAQTFVDRFSRVYTPSVVGAAILVFLLPPLLGWGAWSTWFYRALMMLVIACPCALVISTPVSIVSGLAAAARGGVLIKGGVHLENASAATAVAFDKTGTLTLGQPFVVDVVPLDNRRQEQILSLAAALEQGSEHPLAQAILREAQRRSLSLPAISAFEALPGRGIRASINGDVFFLGNERFCHEIGVCTPASEQAQLAVQSQGQTAVLLFSAAAPIAIIALADQPRPEAAETIRSLRALGLKKIIMLTGDNVHTAEAIAKKLGIDDFRSELMPEEKVEIVRQLQDSGQRIVFVGDGVNDAPALAAASVGIAMGAAGTDVALETADIALTTDNLGHLPFAIRVARKTAVIIRQNIIFSIAIKAVFLVLALGGWATLWMAVAADMGASLAVIANGMRTLRLEHKR